MIKLNSFVVDFTTHVLEYLMKTQTIKVLTKMPIKEIVRATKEPGSVQLK
jgi:hypothetical protein